MTLLLIPEGVTVTADHCISSCLLANQPIRLPGLQPIRELGQLGNLSRPFKHTQRPILAVKPLRPSIVVYCSKEEVFLLKFVNVFQFFNYLLEEMSRCNCFSTGRQGKLGMLRGQWKVRLSPRLALSH